MNASPHRKTAVILAGLILLAGVLLLLIPQPELPQAPAPGAHPPGVATAPADPDAAPPLPYLQPAAPTIPATDYTAMLLQMIISVALVCLLAWAILRWGLGRLVGTRSDTENLRILSRLPIGPRRSILVVQAGEKCLLLGSTETEISLLCEFSENFSSTSAEGQVADNKS